jgi:hypothetical protein
MDTVTIEFVPKLPPVPRNGVLDWQLAFRESGQCTRTSQMG